MVHTDDEHLVALDGVVQEVRKAIDNRATHRAVDLRPGERETFHASERGA